MPEKGPPPVYWHGEHGLITRARKTWPDELPPWKRLSDGKILNEVPPGALALVAQVSDYPVVARIVPVENFLADRAQELREALTMRLAEQGDRGLSAEQVGIVGPVSCAQVLKIVDETIATHFWSATQCAFDGEGWPCTRVRWVAELFAHHQDYRQEWEQ